MSAGKGLLVPSQWNPHWNYRLGGEPRSICACPDGPYEGARLATTPRFCERCGGLVNAAVTKPRDTSPGGEHSHPTGGAWNVTRWPVPGCPACVNPPGSGEGP